EATPSIRRAAASIPAVARSPSAISGPSLGMGRTPYQSAPGAVGGAIAVAASGTRYFMGLGGSRWTGGAPVRSAGGGAGADRYIPGAQARAIAVHAPRAHRPCDKSLHCAEGRGVMPHSRAAALVLPGDEHRVMFVFALESTRLATRSAPETQARHWPCMAHL